MAAVATTGSPRPSAGRRAAGCGWAAGIERILLAAERAAPGAGGGRLRRRGRTASASAPSRSSASCAGAGLRAELDLAGRSLKGQMKQADRIGARRTVILDDDGKAEVRDMSSGEQRDARPRDGG